MGKLFNALKWMKPEDSENLTKNQKDEQRTSLIIRLMSHLKFKGGRIVFHPFKKTGPLARIF